MRQRKKGKKDFEKEKRREQRRKEREVQPKYVWSQLRNNKYSLKCGGGDLEI